MIMEKRGQATIFIILGVIVVIIAVSLSYLQNEGFREKVQNIAFRSVVVPEQAQGIVGFVNGCVNEITREGIDILGGQGGYISLPDISPRAYLQATENKKMPYWIYGLDNIENIPAKGEMEEDLRNYIEGQFMERCGFDSYRELGYIIPNDDINIDVKIADKEVRIDLVSDLSVNIKGDEFDLSDYVFVNIPSRLNEFYEMANEIIDRERINSPLEFNTINLISLWSKDDESGIPKVTGISFDCDNARYNLEDVGAVLVKKITQILPYLQIERSNIQTYNDAFYNTQMIIENTFSRNHNDVNVDFNYYEGWPFILDINPRSGNLLKSDVLRVPIPFRSDICFSRENFRYNLIYPILITLESGDESFDFAIEVYLDNNFGRRNNFGRTSFRNTEGNLFCDKDQRLSEEMSIKAADAATNEILNDVMITYRCGVNECVVGNIEEDEYIGRFPQCVGGEIKLTKEGYGIYREPWDTLDEPFKSVTANLEPYRGLRLNIKALDLDENNNVINPIGRDLRENEEVFLQLSRRNEVFGGVDEDIIVSYDKNEEIILNLVPGRYNLNIDIILNEQRELAGQNINGLNVNGERVDSLLLGHVELDDVYINPSQLLNEDIVLKVLAVDPLTVGDVLRAYEMEEAVDNNRELLDPEYN